MLLGLPNFNDLHSLSKKHSAPIDQLMRSEIRLLINNAPTHYKPRLKGILFEMNAHKCKLQDQTNADFIVASRAHRALIKLQAHIEKNYLGAAANDIESAKILPLFLK